MRLFLFITVLGCLAFSTAMAQRVDYYIHIDEENPLIANVVMKIPDHSRAVRLYSRAAVLQTQSQIRDVVCGNTMLSMNDESEWVLPSGCTVVSWTVDIATIGEDGIAAYDQKTIISKTAKWWIFSTPTGILRLKNENAELNAHFNVPYQNNFSAKLPTGRQAPGFYAVGDVPIERFNNGRITLNYISDNPELTAQFVKPEDHVKALDYLSGIIGLDDKESQEITMVLLGITRQNQSLGGAAGHKTMLVNYIFDTVSATSKEVYFPIIIAIHEQIHQLSLARPHITWVSESLAHYYASKAALIIYPDNQVVRDIANELYASSMDGQPGLVDIQTRIDERQDYTHYSNFYNQGSAFWNAVDLTIQKATNGNENLDDYLALIMRTEFKKGEGFPRRIKRALSFITEEKFKSLEDQYLFSKD